MHIQSNLQYSIYVHFKGALINIHADLNLYTWGNLSQKERHEWHSLWSSAEEHE